MTKKTEISVVIPVKNEAGNIDGLISGFAYAASIITSQSCTLSNSAARTGGHMINSHINKYTTIQADRNYANFRKAGSLYRDGDRVVAGLQLVFETLMHKLQQKQHLKIQLKLSHQQY